MSNPSISAVQSFAKPAPMRGPDKTPRAKSKSISAVDFEGLRPFLTGIADHRVEAARRVLVDKAKLVEVADEHGYKSRQAVGRCVDAVWPIYERYRESQQAKAEAERKADKTSRIAL